MLENSMVRIVIVAKAAVFTFFIFFQTSILCFFSGSVKSSVKTGSCEKSVDDAVLLVDRW